MLSPCLKTGDISAYCNTSGNTTFSIKSFTGAVKSFRYISLLAFSTFAGILLILVSFLDRQI